MINYLLKLLINSNGYLPFLSQNETCFVLLQCRGRNRRNTKVYSEVSEKYWCSVGGGAH